MRAHRSHNFTSYDGENEECMFCLSKPWHEGAEYPCGLQPKGYTVDEQGRWWIVWQNDEWEQHEFAREVSTT